MMQEWADYQDKLRIGDVIQHAHLVRGRLAL